MSFVKGNEYDRGVNTFSPEGRLFQIEYAREAIKLGSTAIGIACTDGVVFAVEKRITTTLVEPQSIEKIMEMDNHIGCAMSGLTADARSLVDHARNECLSHWFTYNEPISVERAVHAVSDLALDFSDVSDGKRKKTMSRPFGVALLVGGVDENGSGLFVADPSGLYTKYKAEAIGSAQEGARSLLQQGYKPDLSFKEAEELALGTLRQVMEEKISKSNVELASVLASTKKYHLYPYAEVDAVISRLPASTLPTLGST